MGRPPKKRRRGTGCEAEWPRKRPREAMTGGGGAESRQRRRTCCQLGRRASCRERKVLISNLRQKIRLYHETERGRGGGGRPYHYGSWWEKNRTPLKTDKDRESGAQEKYGRERERVVEERASRVLLAGKGQKISARMIACPFFVHGLKSRLL